MFYNHFSTLPDLSEVQISQMEHCVGLGNKAKKSGKGYYQPYRNYYDAGGNDIEVWESLKKLGLADKGRTYHLTKMGLDALSQITGIVIYSENAYCLADAKSEVLKAFIDQDVAICYGCWYPTSAKYISEITRIPLPMVRRCVNKLLEEGLLVKGHEGGIDDGGNPYCYHGYFCTDKAKELDYWKKAHEREENYINESLRKGAEGGAYV